MKLFIKIGVCAVVILVLVLSLNKGRDNDYIRIHIIANSNSEIDECAKLDIKDAINIMLAGQLSNAKSKAEGLEIINKNIDNIAVGCNRILREKGLNYNAVVSVNNEYCPSRKYSNTTVESGYYDTLVISLGSGAGDNWWCVIYPPLCYNGEEDKLKFSSRVKEWFGKIFS